MEINELNIKFPLTLQDIENFVFSLPHGIVRLSGGQAIIRDSRLSKGSLILTQKVDGTVTGEIFVIRNAGYATLISSNSSDNSWVVWIAFPINNLLTS